ncbi:MAG: ECF transporter S component, partial [Roseburia sp.]|nr:ECF transporter S component [Roseburia sp.]
MALNIALSSFGVPVPGGHFYLNDIVICTAAILLDPFSAFLVGGV